MYGSVDELPAIHSAGEHLPGGKFPKSYPIKAMIGPSLIVIQFLTLSPNKLKQMSE